MAHAKHHHATWQPIGKTAANEQLRQHLAVQFGARGAALFGAQGAEQSAPQNGLPKLLAGQGHLLPLRVDQHVFALSPVLQPVGAVVLVLVKQIGQLAGQLQPTGLIVQRHLRGDQQAVRAEVAGHGAKCGLCQQTGQQLHQSPGHGQFVERRLAGHGLRAQHLSVSAPDKSPWQFDLGGRTHPQLLGLCHLEPLGHATALDQNDFFFKWRQGVAALPSDHGLSQILGPVAVQDKEPWRQG